MSPMFQDVISRIHRGSSTTSQSDGLPARRHVLLAVRDPVDHTPRVVTQIHRPVTTKRNPHRTPHPTSSFLLARCQPPGNEILRATLRLPFVVESHAYNFVSGRNAPIPRSMKCDEDVVPVIGGELRPFIKGEPQRSRVRLHLDLGLEHVLAAGFFRSRLRE